eukprot:TRINITY_DN13503_c0_g1_i1.p1 TRINITY_DN13503_c0_g1~~TRINITY_DN13503_c0_g1_i1.p1  ORF type:complete len:345 (+),score=48.06 TRINITY_DN13503_c0_g1_i1:57-1037(+)
MDEMFKSSLDNSINAPEETIFEDTNVGETVALIIVLLLLWSMCCCCRLCCPAWLCPCGVCCCTMSISCNCPKRGNAEVDNAVQKSIKVDGETEPVPVEYLRQRKSTVTAWWLLWSSGLVGGHHFYLDKVVHGITAAVTVNFLGVGWFLDMLLMPGYLWRANTHTSAAAVAPEPGCRFCSRLCLGLVLAVVWWIGLLSWFPVVLETGFNLDPHMELANTTANPYDVLGVPRYTPHEDIKKKYATASGVGMEKQRAFAYIKEVESKSGWSPSKVKEGKPPSMPWAWIAMFNSEALINYCFRQFKSWLQASDTADDSEGADSSSHGDEL